MAVLEAPAVAADPPPEQTVVGRSAVSAAGRPTICAQSRSAGR